MGCVKQRLHAYAVRSKRLVTSTPPQCFLLRNPEGNLAKMARLDSTLCKLPIYRGGQDGTVYGLLQSNLFHRGFPAYTMTVSPRRPSNPVCLLFPDWAPGVFRESQYMHFSRGKVNRAYQCIWHTSNT